MSLTRYLFSTLRLIVYMSWWTDGGSNPNLRGANAMCSHYHYQPMLLEHREGFEPPVFRICNPVHWTALPPMRCLVRPEGVEPPTLSV